MAEPRSSSLEVPKWEEVAMPAASFRKGVEPLGVGIIGPPGSGKTRSVLRLLEGARRVRPGQPVVLIDTEGRSRKYSPKPGEKADPSKGTYDFLRIDLDPPYRSDRCLEAIKQALKVNPAAIGFDTLSDEHDGEGGYLEWHDAIEALAHGEPGNVGGNAWAAWSKPAAARKRLTTALLHIDVPLFFTFRAAEKTAQEKDNRGKQKVVKLGWMPIAPLLIVKSLDLTCILPWDSKGTPVWKMQDLPGEDFVRKWPEHLLGIIDAGQLTEDTGEALARWAMGDAGNGAKEPRSQGGAVSPGAGSPQNEPSGKPDGKAGLLLGVVEVLKKHLGSDQTAAGAAVRDAFGCSWKELQGLPAEQIAVGLGTLRKTLEGLAGYRREAEKRGHLGDELAPPSTADSIDWPDRSAEGEIDEPGADDDF